MLNSLKMPNFYFLGIDYKFKFATTDQVFENHDCCRKVRFFCSPPNAYPDFNNVGRILWLKGRNDELVHGRQTVQYHNSLRRDVIEFNATETDAGQISCVYIHEAGSRRHNMYLKINGKMTKITQLLKLANSTGLKGRKFHEEKNINMEHDACSYSDTNITVDFLFY